MTTQDTAVGLELGPIPLVETKLTPPRPRPTLISRPRLHEALDAFASSELTLISAPAGSGKTVLLGSWCAVQSHAAVAWVSLDETDDDPVRLWTYIATSVDRVRSGLGRMALLRLKTPGIPIETCVDELLNGVAAYGEPLALALDDLHTLRNAACLESLEYAIEHLPRNARIIATARADPPIALARLRGRGQLGELRARELAFSLDEARAFLVDREALVLDEHDLGLLVERSEGWPAGLYMAALWLRGAPDPKEGVAEFRGDHRHVADFLTSEVIASLDEETRDFLLKTSVLGRFTAPLCDAVLGTTSAAAMLESLAHSNLFLVSLDGHGEWYRYHHLFSDLLRMELEQSDPTAERALQVGASAWCRSQGLIEEAIEHASSAGDEALVADLLLEQHLSLLRSGRFATLLRHVASLPAEILVAHPELAAVGALASGLQSRGAAERRRFLTIAERARVEHPEAWSPYAQATVSIVQAAWIDDDVGLSVENGRRAAQLGREGEDEIAVPALASLAYALYLAGDGGAARAAAREATDRPEAPARPHGLLTALATLSILETEAGRASAGEATARQALTIARKAGLLRAWSTGLAYVALASALETQGELRQAEHEAERGEALRECPDACAEHVHALLVLARVRAARGQTLLATNDLASARESMAGFADPGRLPELARTVERALDDARLGAPSLIEEPTRAELNVLRMLATDLSQREIGERLFLSLNTVKTHTRGIYRKLGVTSREDAVTRAAGLGLLEESESPG